MCCKVCVATLRSSLYKPHACVAVRVAVIVTVCVAVFVLQCVCLRVRVAKCVLQHLDLRTASLMYVLQCVYNSVFCSMFFTI